jgi:hypothetical protein
MRVVRVFIDGDDGRRQGRQITRIFADGIVR